MSLSGILNLLADASPPRLLIVGDLMLDRYVTGNAERISPEAPVVVLRAGEHEVRPGGAAGVAAFSVALEARVSLLGVVGNDSTAQTLLSLCRDDSIDTSSVVTDAARPTTLKERFIGGAADRHGHQILRVDHECREPVSGAIEQTLIDAACRQIPNCDIVVISDYAKGVCTSGLLRAVIKTARQHDIPVIVDPGRGHRAADYAGATLLKPNRIEAEELGHRAITTSNQAMAVAAALRDDAQVEAVIVTLDADGCVVATSEAVPTHLRTMTRQVYDITGAGDMFVATLARCMAAGIGPTDAARLANVASGLEVERAGSTPVSLQELREALTTTSRHSDPVAKTVDGMARLAESCRRNGQRVVLTNGCFDLLHYGHVRSLQEAAAMGDVLIVAINSDTSVRQLKGPDRPVISEHERAAMLGALACVDHVLIFDDETPHHLLNAIRPDVLVKGGAYALDEVVGHEIVEAYGGKVAVTAHVAGLSTTSLVSTIRETPCT
ncbi:MAG: D-glycero-beta-D-manno-heptose 1-phosphate adenylyltransferase [Rhodopirellula sp.]|nr:D-glycero-beta-D-manno-heptose 1-phosphate adenylyltransferase [Rhodopirellula sp.]